MKNTVNLQKYQIYEHRGNYENILIFLICMCSFLQFQLQNLQNMVM